MYFWIRVIKRSPAGAGCGKRGEKVIYKALYLMLLFIDVACLFFVKKKYPECFRVYLVYALGFTAAYTALWKAGGFPIFIWD